MQKLVLLSTIGQDRASMVDMGASALDQLKMYINPQVYFAEQEYSSALEEDSSTRKNAVYMQQIESARATGKLRSPRFVREAIHEFYQEDQNASVEKTFVEFREDGTVIEHNTNVANLEDDEVIG